MFQFDVWGFIEGLTLLVVGYGVGVVSGIMFQKAKSKLVQVKN